MVKNANADQHIADAADKPAEKENKYRVIYDEIVKQLQAGEIKPGGKLPSIREITVRFGCSKNTVIRAYDDLEKEHLIYSVPKSGYYAMAPAAYDESPEQGVIDLSSAAPDRSVMPYEEYQHCLNRAIDLYQDRLFSYSDPQGFLSLRKELEKHLASAQVFAKLEQISVVSGAQQALHLLAAMPFPNGKTTVLVEQPTFFGMLRTLELLQVPAVGITRTEEGLDLDELERHFRNNNIKCFYTMPRFHNPLGTSLSQGQKKKIARLAAKYDVYIIEDDYLADLEVSRKADPIFSVDEAARTIYIKSFSKVMLPGLRLAAVVLPLQLVASFRMFKASCDSSTASLSQGALEIYLSGGMFDRHVAQMRVLYQERIGMLAELCAKWLPQGMKLSAAEAGIFAQISVPHRLPAEELAAVLRQQRVLVTPMDRCYLRGFASGNGLRLSVIRADRENMERGIKQIGETAAALLERKSAVPSGAVIEWV
ncbi:PLP-dependent aminotransferase family protein [Paenibacillus thalictri]|uniref:PLP-dependent aminotransferase family protein n=1 Tax=Paenibacillus thalictri TaxID=2527873 RepID=A0A4Q9DGD8_9BACL|nr:PLP-dependent aminotransferase family protein [Paenibacillus thalictri]TBL68216.1 PLP-dependent aminotransferase family protein [Paenibacillus thalictri]